MGLTFVNWERRAGRNVGETDSRCEILGCDPAHFLNRNAFEERESGIASAEGEHADDRKLHEKFEINHRAFP